MLLSILLALLPVQDDFSKWIARLESESIEEREEATRRLQALGPASVERLEKAREAARDPEVKARLGAIIVSIGKAVELAKVFGPTKRVTIAARGRPLKEILAELVAPGIATVDSGLLDPEARLDLQIREATWWEALDRTARAAGARYEIQDNQDGRVRISLVRGKEPEGQVVYLEQFRISVVEAKRFDYRTPAERNRIAMVVVEVRHQPDLKPGGRMRDDAVRFDSVLDAKGEDAKAPPPESIGGSRYQNSRRLGLQEVLWVRPDAPVPLTISGRTDISFPSETREIALDLSGEGSTARAGPATLQVTGFAATPLAARLSLKVEAKDLPDLSSRIADEVFLVDSKGGRHPGAMRSSGGGDDRVTWEFEFPPGLAEPKRVVVRWIAEFHRVELPFRLEGVRLP